MVIVWEPASVDTVTCPTAPSLSGNKVIVATPEVSTVAEKAVPCTVTVAKPALILTSPPKLDTEPDS